MAHTLAYKTILAPVSGDDGDVATLRLASALAARFDGHVDAVFANPRAIDLVPTTGEGVSAGVVEQLIKSARTEINRRLATAEATVESVAAETGLEPGDGKAGSVKASYTFRTIEGREDDIAATTGLTSDVIVLDRRGDNDSPQPMLTIEEALISSGRPLLIAPPTVTDSLDGPVAVAWSRTSQAAHALAGAMPLLSRAESVHILFAGTGKTEASAGEAVVEFLARHGIQAKAHAIDAGSRSVGAALLDRASEVNARVLVMGGYGHSRWRQMILGGVTRHVLSNATIPVLMAH
jgi:nucleotide-binding universal stress UspA family protein